MATITNHNLKMTKKMNSEFLIDKLINGIIIALILFLIQTGVNYFLDKKKIKNKSEIENLYAEKQKTYFEAIDLINTYLSNDNWYGNEIPDNINEIKLVRKPMPDMIQVNNCYSKLVLFSENEEIFKAFLSIFSNPKDQEPHTIRFAKLLNLMRIDLGYDSTIIKPEKYRFNFIINPLKNSTR